MHAHACMGMRLILAQASLQLTLTAVRRGVQVGVLMPTSRCHAHAGGAQPTRPPDHAGPRALEVKPVITDACTPPATTMSGMEAVMTSVMRQPALKAMR